MKRILTWCAVIAASFLCAISGLSLYGLSMNYRDLKNDINRQLNEINTLRLAQGQDTSRPIYIQSVSETVSFMSAQIDGFNLIKRSVQTEKSNLDIDGWEEWRIEAVCIGSIHDLSAFIDSLEAAGTYQNASFTVEINNEDLYKLSIELRFFARHV